MGDVTTLLAHQGGWDEALLVAGPLVVFAALLAVARRRADREAAEEAGGGPDAVAPGDPRDGGPG